MKLIDTLLQANMRAVLRLTVIFLVVCAVDSAAVLLLDKPFPWVMMIPATLPLWVTVFVVQPMIRDRQVAVAASTTSHKG